MRIKAQYNLRRSAMPTIKVEDKTGALDYCKTQGKSLIAPFTTPPPPHSPHFFHLNNRSHISSAHSDLGIAHVHYQLSICRVKNTIQMESVITLQDWFDIEAFILDFFLFKKR